MTHSVLLVGFGLGARVFHAPLIATTPGMRIDGIVTSSPERQQQARELYPEATLHSSLDEAWLQGYELAVISTANASHVTDATACLTHGLHIVLDKPIAPDFAHASALRDLAVDRGLMLIPYQNRRWDTEVLTALSVMASGRIGAIHRLIQRIDRMRVVPKDGWRNSSAPEDMGGMLYDLGAHAIDQARVLMGPVQEVYARVRTVRRPGDPDDDSVVVLTHTSGAVSVVTVSQAAAFPEPRMMLLGTKGGLRIDHVDAQEIALAAGILPNVADWGSTTDTAVLRISGAEKDFVDEALAMVPGSWPTFYRGVAEALDGDGPAPVPIDDVLQTVRVMDAARESGRTGEAVRLHPPA
jgi:scyllo-inositol 2-dehydrogenase (NADP+)